MIHETVVLNGEVTVGRNVTVGPYCVLGTPGKTLHIPDNSLIRSHTIIYGDVTLGEGFTTGHHCLVRGLPDKPDSVVVGKNVKIGSYTSIEGDVQIGDKTIIRGKSEIPSCRIGERVQMFAYTMFYDTPQPPGGPVVFPVIEDDVVLCCDVRVLGGITVGKSSYVTAGQFIKTDIPPGSYVSTTGIRKKTFQ